MAKAAILEQVGGLTIGEVELADPGPHEVLIDTKACGLCHSDLHFIDGAYPHPLPAIPGHEAAGVAAPAAGAGVAAVGVPRRAGGRAWVGGAAADLQAAG